MTERALELLCLPDEPCYLLDLGCGSGLSGECIEEQVTFFHSSHGSFSYLGRGMSSTFLFSLNIQPNFIISFLQGHSWVGLDISSAMLGVANERELEGDLACGDLGEGLPFR